MIGSRKHYNYQKTIYQRTKRCLIVQNGKGDDRKVIQKMTSDNRRMLQGRKKILVIERIVQKRDEVGFGK